MTLPVSRVKSRLVPSRISQAWRELSSWLSGADAEYGPGTRERLLNGLVRHPEDSLEDALDAATGITPRLAEELLPRVERVLPPESEPIPGHTSAKKDGVKAA